MKEEGVRQHRWGKVGLVRGSVCQACRIKSRHFRAGSLAGGGGVDFGQGAASLPPAFERPVPFRAHPRCLLEYSP